MTASNKNQKYKVTAYPSSNGDRYFKLETFDAFVVEGSPVLKSNTHFELERFNVLRDNERKIVALDEKNYKNKVLINFFTDSHDIENINRLLGNVGVAAIFTREKPRGFISVPTFQVDFPTLRQLSSLIPGKVIFECLTKNIEDTTLKSPVKKMDYFQDEKDISTEKYEKSIHQTIENQTEKSNSGILDTIWNAIPKPWSKSLGDLLKESSGWDLSHKPSNYEKAMQEVTKANDSDSQRKIISQVENFLQHSKNIQFGHLTVLASICLNFQNEHTDNIHKFVVQEVLDKFHISHAAVHLKIYEKYARSEPCIILFEFLKLHIRKEVNSQENHAAVLSSHQCLNVLIIAYGGQLLTQKFQSDDWKLFKHFVGAMILDVSDQDLFVILSKPIVCKIMLCFQPKLENLVELTGRILKRTQEKGDYRNQIFSQKYFSELVHHHLHMECENTPNDERFLTIAKDIFCLLNVLCVWDTYTYRRSDFRNDVVKTLVSMTQFKNRKSFELLLKLRQNVEPTHPDSDLICNEIIQAFSRDFKSKDVNLREIKNLMLNQLILSLPPSAQQDLFHCIRKDFLPKCFKFEEKLECIGYLYNFMAPKTPKHKIQSMQKSIFQDIQQAVGQRDCIEVLSSAIFVAAYHANLFFTEENVSFTNEIAKLIVLDRLGTTLLDDTRQLATIEFPIPDSGEGGLYSSLKNRLDDILRQRFKQLRDASRLLLGLKDSNSSWILDLSQDIYVQSFKNWNPQTMLDIHVDDKDVVNVLFMEDINTDVKICKNHVIRLVDKWMKDFENNNLSHQDLECALNLVDSHPWQTLFNNYLKHDMDFKVKSRNSTEKSHIVDKIKTLIRLEGDIIKHLTISVQEKGESIALASILNEFNCYPSENEAVHSLLKVYEVLTIKAIDKNKTSKKMLSKIYSDEQNAYRFAKENETMLKICAYMTFFPSILFKDRVVSARGNSRLFASLKDAVLLAQLSISILFGPSSTYRVVRHAWSVLESTVNLSGIDSEMNNLIGCPHFNITVDDVRDFQKAVLLVQMADPLRHFIFCCERFDFVVSTSDISFLKMKSIYNEFFNENVDMRLRNDCLNFLNEIGELLSINSDPNIGVDHYLPLFEIFSTLASFPEVWDYVDSMGWFGDDGLKRFYNEHSNVTNVLLGSSASYEMSVLDSMEPAVRLISTIGSFRNVSQMQLLLSMLNAHESVMNAFKSDTTRDFRQVHEKLSDIRDWFGNGVDEIAATQTIFKCACTNGRYFFSKSNDVKKNKHNLHGAVNQECVSLSLKFINTEEDKEADRIMSNKDLIQFIQHLSQIQDENPKLASNMKAFIEQYHIVTKAANNALIMHKVGYDEFLLEEFDCAAGYLYVEEANDLFTATTYHLMQFESWLGTIESQYPETQLFWIEEIQEIHEILQKIYTTNDDMDINDLSLKTQKVLDLKMNNSLKRTDWYELVHTCVTERQIIETQTKSWYHATALFLNRLHMACGATRIHKNKRFAKIVLHTVESELNRVSTWNLQILRDFIYKDRLPTAFEVLDGTILQTPQYMERFLERAQRFTSHTFTILSTESLETKALEVLFLFLSNKQIETSGVQLHIFQGISKIIPSAPWIHQKLWSHDEVTKLSSQAICTTWKDRVVDGTSISSVTVVTSKLCGSGKTRFIRNRLKQLESACSSDDELEIGTIVIHNKSTAQSVLQDLLKKFVGKYDAHALYVSFMVHPDQIQEQKWLQDINHLFFSILVLRYLNHPESSRSFSFRDGHWDIFVEFPSNEGKLGSDWLEEIFPVLSSCSSYEQPPDKFEVNKETRRVCTYLRALSTGTIDRKFCGSSKKRIVFVLDQSGSMGAELENGLTAFKVAINNAVELFERCIDEEDEFGVILFDHEVSMSIPIQNVGQRRVELQRTLQNLLMKGGGTNMYAALCSAVQYSLQRDGTIDTWIVCLTDGESADTDYNFRTLFLSAPKNFHLIVVGVNLNSCHEEKMRLMCNRYVTGSINTTKGFFVRAEANATGIDLAFNMVKKAIPVSKTFELDGPLSDKDCNRYISRYLPHHVSACDMISKSFWIKFLYRRVRVFDENQSFNYNESCDNLGSTLMVVMLQEVERLLNNEQCRNWTETNYAQLIYDFEKIDAPEFRLICTAPDEMDEQLLDDLQQLELPNFFVPTKRQLECRETLDRYLSQALCIPLQKRSDGSRYLACIDEHNFILTLDFTIKLLIIHERVECRIPCVLEGETGVSKTALTKMYSILRNSALLEQAKSWTNAELANVVDVLQSEGFTFGNDDCVHLRLKNSLQNGDGIAARINQLLHFSIQQRPRYLDDIPFSSGDSVEETVELLNNFCCFKLVQSFFEIKVDSSLTERDFVDAFHKICVNASRLQESNGLVVVFLDEINTSSVLGLLKEIVIDHSLSGVLLPTNITIISACNPCRLRFDGEDDRERDLGRDWASGHYQVVPLPDSLQKLTWSFASLRPEQEKEFIFRKLELLDSSVIPLSLRASLTETIAASHEAIRKFAEENILQMLQRVCKNHYSEKELHDEARVRSRSVVSLRDIQRIFALHKFLLDGMIQDLSISIHDENRLHHRAILLAIAIVYYMRLDFKSREKFLAELRKVHIRGEEGGDEDTLLCILNDAMQKLLAETVIPSGIAATRGLKENIFLTLICLLSQTPLMIIGPPGCSKTLSVNIVQDNANGSDSLSKFYASRPRLSLFHYQCSKQSSSKEIAAVFEKACQRQERVHPSKQRCVVFMDEAGLPEEGKESLKVLHYLLEGHMSAKAEVGFVAISNHILDAAKSNRCIVLLRQEPDEEEMLDISFGVLFDCQVDGHKLTHDVDINGHILDSQEFARSLCKSYEKLITDMTGTDVFSTANIFFGLRDFIFLLKQIRMGSERKSLRMVTSIKSITYAIERNFNGVNPDGLMKIASYFLSPLSAKLGLSQNVPVFELRDPIIVLRDAITSNSASNVSLADRSRFMIIIDSTEDDSILRLLKVGGFPVMNKRLLCKLSHLQEDSVMEQLQLVSKVKFAALQGHLAVLSQTEPINESFYDLFNQRYVEVVGRDGKTNYFTNIAVGGVSRRSLVHPGFHCIIHLRESHMKETPVPFLNRFEKYRLDISEIVSSHWKKFGNLAVVIMHAKAQTASLVSMFERSNGNFGWLQNQQVVDSVFVDIIPTLEECLMHERSDPLVFSSNQSSFVGVLKDFFSRFISIDVDQHLGYCLDLAEVVLSEEALFELRGCLEGRSTIDKMVDSVQSLLVGDDNPTSHLIDAVKCIIQLMLTRAALFRLLQVVTPEIIFMNRSIIPHDLLNAYFVQEHFSLKQLVHQLTELSVDSSTFTVIHTRTDQYVNFIPSMRMDMNFDIDEKSLESIQQLVYDNSEDVITDHVTSLHSASMIKSMIEAWAELDSKKILMLIIDMSGQTAFEQANYIRLFVEQEVSTAMHKTFILLLHYSTSGSHKGRCYPALFLSGWEHFFLDGIGGLESFAGIGKLIAYASSPSKSQNDRMVFGSDFSRILEGLLPRVLLHISTQRIFYPQQELKGRSNFVDTKLRLKQLMNVSLGQKRIGSILCEKFAEAWLMNEMERRFKKASDQLANGYTQLSLTSSIYSIILQSFQQYLAHALVEANQWLNFDIAFHITNDCEKAILFGKILRSIPVPPFEELTLKLQHGGGQLVALSSTHMNNAAVMFPFFYLVSGYLDIVIEKAEKLMVHTSTYDQDDSVLFNSVCAEECFRKSADIVCGFAQDLENSQQGKFDIRVLVHDVVSFVEKSSTNIFHDYLLQYLQIKLGINNAAPMVSCIETKLEKWNATKNIVGIHILGRFKSTELRRLAACKIFSQTLSLTYKIPPSITQNLDSQDIGSKELFDTMLHALKFICMDGPINLKSSQNFARLLRHVQSAYHQSDIESDTLFLQLRMMIFIFTVRKLTQVNHGIDDKIFQLRSVVENPSQSKHSIIELLAQVGISNEHYSFDPIAESLLRHFFSSEWLEMTDMFWIDDFKFLLDWIQNSTICSKFCRVKTCLLQIAVKTRKGTMKIGSKAKQMMDVALTTLSVKGDIGHVHQGVFHYIPVWLQRVDHSSNQAHTVQTSDFENDNNEFKTFFVDYAPTIEGHLPNRVFEVLLEDYGDMYNKKTSEIIFLDVLKDLCKLKSAIDCFTRPNELHKCQPLMLRMEIAARLVCFVAKVATEIAIEMQAVVLCGIYAADAHVLLETMMTQDSSSWDFFFFSTILRIRGEGALCNALSVGGPLHDISWCKVWRDSSPLMKSSVTENLREAETNLAEMMIEEEKKSREFRLCPGCSHPFIVAAVNCGNFVCGQVPTRDGTRLGCGRSFNLSTAQYYKIDSKAIEVLQEKVDVLRQSLNIVQKGECLWEQARSIPVPVLVHNVCVNNGLLPSYLPSSSFPDDTRSTIKIDDSTSKLVKVLWTAAKFAPLISLLPDVIEFYLWLHDTFRHVLSKKQAYSTLVQDVLTESRLTERFDTVYANHVVSLWSRVQEGLERWIEDNNNKVWWQCQEIEIQLKKLHDAPLVSLLSEGDHPTDGNDLLFLFISFTVDRYNEFALEIQEFFEVSEHEQTSLLSLQPNSIVRGYEGALSLNSFLPLQEQDIKLYIESSWDETAKSYDTPKLNELLLGSLATFTQPPQIANPMTELREKFRFLEFIEPLKDMSINGTSSFNTCGFYFAHEQDFQLVCEVETRLKMHHFKVGGGDFDRILSVNFYDLEYDQIRAILEGCRNVFDLNQSQIGECESFGELMFGSVAKGDTTPLVHRLTEFGFPELRTPQVKMIFQLKMCQISELMMYLAYQLSTEGYIFGKLPLFLQDPLTQQDKNVLERNLRCSGLSGDILMRDISTFSFEVLSFYETVIRDTGMSSNCSLRTYLSTNNFCDTSDPVFAALPHSVNLRHYVALRQHLNHLRLLFQQECMSRKKSSDSVVFFADDEQQNHEKAEKCYLWYTTNNTALDDKNSLYDKNELDVWKNEARALWFVVDSGTENIDATNDVDGEPEETNNLVGEDHKYDPLDEDVLHLKEVTQNKVFLDDHDPCDIVDSESKQKGMKGSLLITDDESTSVTTITNRIIRSIKDSGEMVSWFVLRRIEVFVFIFVFFISAHSVMNLSHLPRAFMKERNVSLSSNEDVAVQNCLLLESNDQLACVMSIMKSKKQASSKVELWTTKVQVNDENMKNLRLWLELNNLSLTLAEELLKIGVRSPNDLILVVTEHQELLNSLLPLDRLKLIKVVKSMKDLYDDNNVFGLEY